MKERYLLRIPQKLKEEAISAANERGVSVNALILQVLWRYLHEGGVENGTGKQNAC